MNAIQVLRAMHADAKHQLKVILAADDPRQAQAQWQALQPVLELHEQLEDQFVYGPLSQEHGAGTPLGDWLLRHDADVQIVKELIARSDGFQPGTPDWRMGVGQVADALNKHVTDEEGQIFGRIEQVWDADRLSSVGGDMQKAKDQHSKPAAASARRRR